MALQGEATVVPAILLSDVSIVEQGTQKRSIVGIFDQFAFPQFPMQIGRFQITAWISNLAGTTSALELTTRIQERDSAHVIFSSSGNLQFPSETTLDPTQILAFNTTVNGIIFPKHGVYTIVLLLNGDEVGKRDIHVRLIPQGQIPPPTIPLQ